MPPNTNRGPAVAGGWVRLGGRKLATGSCRDEIILAFLMLTARTGERVFTVREVYAEMVSAGTRYAESAAFKTMQRMKVPPVRAPFVQLERVDGADGFRITGATVDS